MNNSTLGTVLGKEEPVQQVDEATYADIMRGAGVPDFLIPILLTIQKGNREGTLEIESNDFEKLLERPAKPINEGGQLKSLKVSINSIIELNLEPTFFQ